MHGMFFTPKADELRTFIRDKLGFTYTDIGGGWLIFDVPEGDLGVHPADETSHSVSFYCDDISKTVKELKSREVEFTSRIKKQNWGKVAHFRMPGDLDVVLYEANYVKRTRGNPLRAREKRRGGTKKGATNR